MTEVALRRGGAGRLQPTQRARAQAIVEFGLVALMFTLLLMGIVDFAILLNGWLGVTSSARDLARQAAVGVCPTTATSCLAGTPKLPAPTSLGIQGLDKSLATPVTMTISICNPSDLTNCYTGSNLWDAYPGGTCAGGTGGASCAHPAANDSVVLTVVAQIQVVTPLVRPFFGCVNGSNPRCDVPIGSRAVVRYEGVFI